MYKSYFGLAVAMLGTVVLVAAILRSNVAESFSGGSKSPVNAQLAERVGVLESTITALRLQLRETDDVAATAIDRAEAARVQAESALDEHRNIRHPSNERSDAVDELADLVMDLHGTLQRLQQQNHTHENQSLLPTDTSEIHGKLDVLTSNVQRLEGWARETRAKMGRVETSLSETIGRITAVEQQLQKHPQPRPAPDSGSADCQAWQAPIEIYFGPASEALPDDTEKRLKPLEPLFARCPTLELHLEGHADSRGSYVYNLALSHRRIVAVIGHLKRRGFPVQRISHNTLGESSPAADNDTPEGRAMNRRVVLFVVNPRGA